MRKITTLLLIAIIALSGCHVGRALHVATAFTAHQLCAQAFVIRQPVDPLFRDYVRPMVGIPIVKGALRYRIEPASDRVRASLAGGFASEAVYAPGRGCTVTNGRPAPAAIHRSLLQSPPQPLPIRIDWGLLPIVDQAFTSDRRALLIIYDGQVVAERYSTGITPDTRLQSWSMAKSVTNALIGILVRKGMIAVGDQVSGLPSGVTVDRLLRQTSGQPFGSSNSGFDRASRMQFLEADTAAYAATAFVGRPGDHWSYTDANYALLSRVIRMKEGDTAEGVARFADKELFGPTGMQSALLEFDQAGTLMGADWAYASARDWARFGLLFARDGIVNGVRVLPHDWVKYSTTPTPAAHNGYGAGFWTNSGNSAGAAQRRKWGAPVDSFFALGNSGQIILIAPSQRLIVVSLGYALDPTNRQPVEAATHVMAHAVEHFAWVRGG